MRTLVKKILTLLKDGPEADEYVVYLLLCLASTSLFYFMTKLCRAIIAGRTAKTVSQGG